ncbi:MAG TPA: ATP-binding protein [Terriglobales bacterium]|nr:ATP-binding protein [Terriglobales bacterium]
MSFRAKLLLMFSVSVVIVVALVSAIVSATLRRSFERLDQERTAALATQFRNEFARRGQEVSRRVAAVAERDSTLRMAADLARPNADSSPYVNEAGAVATAQQLDLLEFVSSDGAIISSAQWPARFGYKEVLHQLDEAATQPAFLRREDVADGAILGLVAARPVRVAGSQLYVIGGERLDKSFLASLVLPEGVRAMLYRSTGPRFVPSAVTDAAGPVPGADALGPLVAAVLRERRESSQMVPSTSDLAGDEMLHAIPLAGRDGEVLGVFILASSRRELVAIERHIGWVALLVACAGILLGILLSGWVAARVTQPVDELADAARQVAKGNLDARVYTTTKDELGYLAAAFNRMTRDLSDQRDRLVQAERVAAWRELARRLAHELKNPLFPLQITVENLVRARERDPSQFDEVFQESTRTLLAELANLKAIIGRFSDFAKMPAPQVQRVDVNQAVRNALKVFEARLAAGAGGAPIRSETDLDPGLQPIDADPDLLHRALQNLVLNAMDAMPSGGNLVIRTRQKDAAVQIEVSDTGTGLTKEECDRLFTPYYTTKQHGTGLGLAIVQSVVSDHHGKISVESEPGRGTTFRIELPARMPETVLARGADA